MLQVIYIESEINASAFHRTVNKRADVRTPRFLESMSIAFNILTEINDKSIEGASTKK